MSLEGWKNIPGPTQEVRNNDGPAPSFYFKVGPYAT